jgi:hypothetical protein
VRACGDTPARGVGDICRRQSVGVRVRGWGARALWWTGWIVLDWKGKERKGEEGRGGEADSWWDFVGFLGVHPVYLFVDAQQHRLRVPSQLRARLYYAC